MSEETGRQKVIRLLLIVLSLGAVGGGFFLMTKGPPSSDFKPLLTIVQSLDEAEKPIVAMVKRQKGENLLYLYRIEPLDRFKFESIEIIELSEYPEEIVADQNDLGMWLKLKNSWVKYNYDLEEVEKVTARPTVIEDDKVSFTSEQIADNKYKITLSNKADWEKIISKQPISIHTLSSDLDLWLIVFEDEVAVFY